MNHRFSNDDFGPTSAEDPTSFSKTCPGEIDWTYRRSELIADSVIHVMALTLGLFSTIFLVTSVVRGPGIEKTSVIIYAGCLMAMLALSAAYNMWPVSPTKWLLRRFDHSAIYLMIAGTYTPFLALAKTGIASLSLAICIWTSAAVGMLLKLFLPGRFERSSVILCLLLGWSGVMAYDSLTSGLPALVVGLLAMGGILYSVGTIFHLWRRLPFHNAIWHGFVLLAATCHYSAVLATVLS
jgi:hemolysin III